MSSASAHVSALDFRRLWTFAVTTSDIMWFSPYWSTEM